MIEFASQEQTCVPFYACTLKKQLWRILKKCSKLFATSSCCMLETSHKTTAAAHAQVPLHFRLTALTKPRFHVEFHSCVLCVCAVMLIHHFIPHRRSLFRSLSLAACCANFRSHPTWHDEMWKAKNVIFYLLSCRSLSGRKVFQHFHVDFKILSQVFHVFYYLLTQSCGSANNNKIQHTTAPVVVSTIKFHSLSWSGWYFCNKIDEMDNQTSASWEWSSCFSYEHLLNK